MFKTPRFSVEMLEARDLLTTFYVAKNGNDAGAGAADNPFLTIQRAADIVKAGDEVIVQAGDYKGFDVRGKSGAADAAITFSAQTGVRITERNYKTPDGINLEGASYITIQGFTVVGMPRAGIRSVTNNNVILQNNVVDSNARWGIFTAFSDDAIIQNNVASRSGAEHGIYYSNSGDRPIIRNNVVWGNRGAGIHLNADASNGGDGIITGAIVEGNIIYENGLGGGGSGINADGVVNSVFRNNLLYDNHASGISLFQQDGGTSSHDNLLVNNTVVMAADARWAMNIQNGSTGNQLFNNILLNEHPWRGSIDISTDSLAGFVSDNNVMMDRMTLDGGATVLNIDQWRYQTRQDAHSFVASQSELFVNASTNDFHLSALSAAIDKGSSLKAPSTDRDGNARPSGLSADIGVYEYQGSLAVNHAPTAVLDAATVSEDGSVVINVLANDLDIDLGDALTLASLNTAGLKGVATITADGKISYSAGAAFQNLAAGQTANESFTYTIKDKKGAIATASVTVAILGVNDAPTLANDATSVSTGSTATVNVLQNDGDVDAGDALTLVGVDTTGTKGTVTFQANGAVVYDPGAAFNALSAGATMADTFRYTAKDKSGAMSTATVSVVVTKSAAATTNTVVYRINAGGDAIGGTNGWSADSAAAPSSAGNAAAAASFTYSVSHAIDMSSPSLPAGTPMELFQSERYDFATNAELQYNFAVDPGQYEVRLYFAEIYYGAQHAGARVFDVAVNGQVVLDNYDVYADVGGYKAVMKSFDVTSGANLNITFGHVVENPAIKAIEIVRKTASTPTPAPVPTPTPNPTPVPTQTVAYRLNAGGPAIANGGWTADAGANSNAAAAKTGTYSVTRPISLDASVSAGTPMEIFQTERYDEATGAELQYSFAVAAGNYEVHLFFADIYYGTQSVGARVFDVSINGQLVLDNYDIYADVGGYTGVMKSFMVTTGANLTVSFGHVIENPTIKGIEILAVGSAGASALQFAGTSVESLSTPVVSEEQLAPIVSAAIERWTQSGADSTMLAGVEFRIADLGGSLLGLTSGKTVWIDATAAGHGWFVDPTPRDNSEFVGDVGPEGVDLLTVVLHELGHVAGLSDEDQSSATDSVMSEMLGESRRLLPTAALVDSLFEDDADLYAIVL